MSDLNNEILNDLLEMTNTLKRGHDELRAAFECVELKSLNDTDFELLNINKHYISLLAKIYDARIK